MDFGAKWCQLCLWRTFRLSEMHGELFDIGYELVVLPAAHAKSHCLLWFWESKLLTVHNDSRMETV
jgi:hypothetical protein